MLVVETLLFCLCVVLLYSCGWVGTRQRMSRLDGPYSEQRSSTYADRGLGWKDLGEAH
jgi:hypothetical protein